MRWEDGKWVDDPSEPREDVQSSDADGNVVWRGSGPREDVEATAQAIADLYELRARLEQTERKLVEWETKALDWQDRALAAERALRDACDVAIWLSGLDCLRTNAEAWRTWEDSMRPKLHAANALASGEGEKKRVLINTRTGERREWEPGLVLQAEGPLEWELREE